MRDSQLSDHILPTSATMMGVCMTVFSIIRLVEPGHAGVLSQRLLGMDSLVFLASTVASYVSLRSRRLAEPAERLADAVFMVGISLFGVISAVLTLELFR